MLLKRLYEEKLAQASYLIACEETGSALIVDPLRDVGRYIAAAAEEKVRITHVTETHIHADFVSGARDLARATNARLHVSDMGDKNWKYAGIASDTDLLHDGSSFAVGGVRVDVVHTPGHTPEHLTFFVTDCAAANVPLGALTGDFIFVGDVGRPDLLELAAGVAGTKEPAAHDLFRSLQKFKSHPDYLQLWPGHGAGSACGKNLGAMPSTTLGYEKLFNWGLAESDEELFVHQVLSGQPDPPPYFAMMKRVNRDGIQERRSSFPPAISPRAIAAKVFDHALVVDTRTAADFSIGHVSSTINIPHSKSFLKYAGCVLPYDHDIYIIALAGDEKPVVDDLALIGMDRIAGVCSIRSADDFDIAGVALRSTPQLPTDVLKARLARDGQHVIDVRGTDEWELGHIPGALHVPLCSLAARVSELPRNEEIAVHCHGGTRSAIAASILEKSGINVSNVTGGFAEWQRTGGVVEA